MSESPELWAFVLTNVGLFVVSSLLMALSYLAYRSRRGHQSYARSTVGFGFVVLGGLVEPVYQLGVGVDFSPTGTQLMLLEAVETILIAAGLGLLFYAITQHRTRTASTANDPPGSADGEIHRVDEFEFGD